MEVKCNYRFTCYPEENMTNDKLESILNKVVAPALTSKTSWEKAHFYVYDDDKTKLLTLEIEVNKVGANGLAIRAKKQLLPEQATRLFEDTDASQFKHLGECIDELEDKIQNYGKGVK